MTHPKFKSPAEQMAWVKSQKAGKDWQSYVTLTTSDPRQWITNGTPYTNTTTVPYTSSGVSWSTAGGGTITHGMIYDAASPGNAITFDIDPVTLASGDEFTMTVDGFDISTI